ncbi:uncharacterized protein LOC125652413 [Ostrea edulis]|uniref:uncharacterized protein LOC125652413 n=1 Tax=Ostrea edulis TaxID=37623 RepID=UPI0024AED1E4|nr:uncharacterized protein LOC125652413 [Ostrea edulis]
MVIQCVVFKCSNRQGSKAKEKGVSFFRFPKDRRKRAAWIKTINRNNWAPNEYSRVCSELFVDSWHSDDPTDINYRPTLFSYKTREPSETQAAREERHSKRNLLQEINETDRTERLLMQKHHDFSLYSHSYYTSQPDCLQDINNNNDENMILDDVDIKTLKDEGVQCDPDPLLQENLALKKELDDLKRERSRYIWNVEKIANDDAKTKFYTGLPSFAVFMWLFNSMRPKAERMRYWIGSNTYLTADRQRKSKGSLELVDQLLAVLLRLRLGLFTSDIAHRFGISESTFSKYFATWISLLACELKSLNPFPARDIIDRTMPLSFKSKYSSVRVILDCTELFIQKSSSLVNQSMTFSNYKHHTTVKFLVGITPSGVISFVSEGWPGKVSDRELTINSGIIDLLDENDSVMADKGFTIRDLLENKKCNLNIPPFRGACPQFSTDEVFKTQEIASLRIHVERSIGRVKNFHILDGVMPITLQPLVTKIFQVICWLTNLDVPLITN